MLVIEFLENDVKVAECKAQEVFSLTPEQQRSFWEVQDDRNRSIKLRYEDE